jgi:hypothetical protein
MCCRDVIKSKHKLHNCNKEVYLFRQVEYSPKNWIQQMIKISVFWIQINYKNVNNNIPYS